MLIVSLTHPKGHKVHINFEHVVSVEPGYSGSKITTTGGATVLNVIEVVEPADVVIRDAELRKKNQLAR